MYNLVSKKLGTNIEPVESLSDIKRKKFDGKKFMKAALKVKKVLEKEEKQLKEDYEKRRIFNTNY